MNKLPRIVAVVLAYLVVTASAMAQTGGTATNHAFAIGKGVGQQGYTSLLCGSAQLAVGQAAADPICRTLTGDVTLSAAGVTVLGNIPSATTLAGSLLATAIAAPSTPAAGKDSVWVDSTDKRLHDKNDAGTIGTTVVASTAPTHQFGTGVSAAGVLGYAQPSFADLLSSLACSQTPAFTGDVTTSAGACATTIAASAVSYAKIQNVAASRLLGNPAGGAAAPSEISLDPTLGFSGTSLKCTTATTSQIGCLKPDGTTITIAAGIITASGASATAITPGTTTVSGGSANPGYALTNSGGALANNQLFSAAGGYINKFRNGTFAVWQRGNSSVATGSAAPGAYTADGWQVQQTGAQFSCSQIAGNAGVKQTISCVGGTSNTDTLISQPIESDQGTLLASQTVTVQFQFKQDTGIAVTPKISTCFASATDNFTTCTADLASTSLTSCASGSFCTEAYTLAVSSSATNGYRVTIDCNTAMTAAQHCVVGNAEIRVTPGVTTGINSLPPPPELRPITAEQEWCNRYFRATVLVSGAVFSTTQVLGTLFYPTMRTTNPAISQNQTANIEDIISGAFGQSSVSIGVNIQTDVYAQVVLGNFAGMTTGHPIAWNSTTSKILVSSEL